MGRVSKKLRNLLLFGPPKRGTPAVDFDTASTTTLHSGNSSTTFGWAFTANEDVTVTSLGYFDAGQDGLHEAHDVGIFDSLGNLLTFTTVGAGTSADLDGKFRYTDITPFALTQSYTIGATIGDAATDAATYLVTNRTNQSWLTLSSPSSQYTEGGTYTTLTFPYRNFNVGYDYIGSNFKALAESSTPEPGILAPGVGIGSVWLLAWRHRRQEKRG
jgi:hypothetical protein